jgi:hypothetical protein
MKKSNTAAAEIQDRPRLSLSIFSGLKQLVFGTAGVPPAMSAKREPFLIFAPAARCGRDARGPSKNVSIKLAGHFTTSNFVSITASEFEPTIT